MLKARNPGHTRQGLTLAELLVVLLLIGAALVIALPWMLRSREGQRQRFCQKRLAEIATAELRLENRLGHFPGYANPLPHGPDAGSWIAVSLTDLGQAELGRAWEKGERPARYLPDLVCPAAAPADPRPDLAWLSYVANCGQAERLSDPACGVYMDLRQKPPALVTLATLEQHDGAGTTLLLSENLQAGCWTSVDVADVGMLWFREPGPCSPINRCRQAPPDAHRMEYARPSSNHAHGVNVAYADTRAEFLSDAIEYRVFQQLMAPDDRAAGLRAK